MKTFYINIHRAAGNSQYHSFRTGIIRQRFSPSRISTRWDIALWFFFSTATFTHNFVPKRNVQFSLRRIVWNGLTASYAIIASRIVIMFHTTIRARIHTVAHNIIYVCAIYDTILTQEIGTHLLWHVPPNYNVRWARTRLNERRTHIRVVRNTWCLANGPSPAAASPSAVCWSVPIETRRESGRQTQCRAQHTLTVVNINWPFKGEVSIRSVSIS